VTGRIDAFVSQEHYLRQLGPVMAAMPPEVRGTLYVAKPEWVPTATKFGVEAKHGRPDADEVIALVAAGRDIAAVREPRPVALMEHGIGQSYEGDAEHPVLSNGYAGGPERERVALFICPNRTVRNANYAVYPDARYAVVGMPSLDRYARWRWHAHRPRVVALSFHWPCGVIGEASTCFPDYRAALGELVAEMPYKFLGHAHPRYRRILHQAWNRLGIEIVDDFDEIMRRADLYVCDNSSTLYEFAATDRPTLTLSCEKFRRDIHHGLRFWEFIPGIECPAPEYLFNTLTEAIVDPEIAQWARHEAVRATVGRADGYAARRAVAALIGAR
jgi:hypothetical protein